MANFDYSSVYFLLLQKRIYSPPSSIIHTTNQAGLKVGANGISLGEAEQVALHFLQGKNHGAAMVIKNSLTITSDNGTPYFHIINANKGFVILSTDSSLCPILAYDSIGHFSVANKDLHLGLLRWLNKTAYQLDYVRNNKNQKTDSIGSSHKKLWRIIGGLKEKPLNPGQTAKIIRHTTDGVGLNVPPPTLISSDPINYSTNSIVGPLCQVAWNQYYPYNQYCPDGSGGASSGGHMPSGCVPTAMAQIMYYWNWPNTYNWSSMEKRIDPSNSATWPDNNPGGYTESARLIHDIGTTSGPVFINAGSGFSTSQFAYYQISGTSADDTYCPYVFGIFGYSSASRTESISDQIIGGAANGTTYADLLTGEIQNYHRPCIVSGYTDEAHPWYLGLFGLLLWFPQGVGHSWVCDGSNVTTFYSGYLETYQDYWGNITTETYIESQWNYSLLHMNWGWYNTTDVGGPANDGWYNCNIDYTTSPQGNGNYSLFQTIIYNIHP